MILSPPFSKQKSWVRVLFVQPNSMNSQNPELVSTSPTQFNQIHVNTTYFLRNLLTDRSATPHCYVTVFTDICHQLYSPYFQAVFLWDVLL